MLGKRMDLERQLWSEHVGEGHCRTEARVPCRAVFSVTFPIIFFFRSLLPAASFFPREWLALPWSAECTIHRPQDVAG